MLGVSTRVGLDPGTANTLLYVEGRGVAVNEPSLVTVRTSTGAIEAVGRDAKAVRGRTPRKFQTARPIRDGVIREPGLFGGMLRCFLRQSRIAGPWRRLEVAAAVPGGMTDSDRLAVVESIRSAGAADVLLADRVLAAARGAGFPMADSRPRMLVDLGAGVTEIAILARGNAIYSSSTRIAGDELDFAIKAEVLSAHDLHIGEPTAERLKIQLGSALPGSPERTVSVTGRCASRGVPRQATVRCGEVQHAISPFLDCLSLTILEALNYAHSDLFETGIVLTGGSALLRNLDQFLSAKCGAPVQLARDSLTSVIRGLADTHDRTQRWR